MYWIWAKNDITICMCIFLGRGDTHNRHQTNTCSNIVGLIGGNYVAERFHARDLDLRYGRDCHRILDAFDMVE